jgi:hypothetical protein
VAEELYLSVLSRQPTDEERKEVKDYIASDTNRRERTIKHLTWALLASAEFYMNH